MNRHLEANHIYKCDNITCDEVGFEHCCLERDNTTQHVFAYCCDIDDYIDKHIVPPIYHSITYEIETPPLHYLGPGDGVTAVFHNHHTPVGPTATDPHLQTHSNHPPSEQMPLGWSYIGIISGIVVLLMFFIVLIVIAYILYRWRNTDRRQRYQADQGHEVVVYHSNPVDMIETELKQTSSETNDKSATSSRYSPPPYTTQKKLLDGQAHVSTENEKTLKDLPQTKLSQS